MPEEYRVAISSSSSLSADEVGRRTFGTVRKGFDPAAVRAFLESVAEELRAGQRREEELNRRIADAERRAASPELDEGTLAAALGAETAKVLQAAHEAAHQVVERAEERASGLLAEAEGVLGTKVAEAEDAARLIREDAHAASETLLDTARADAERLVEATKAECRGMVGEARQVRERVLRDLSDRRRLLRLQVEQLLAGRGALLSAVEGVREAVDDLTTRLAGAELEARAAADAAASDAEVDDAAAIDEVEVPAPAPAGVEEPAAGAEAETPAGAEEPAAGEPAGAEEPEAGEPAQEESKAAVDELFARIRASRAEQVARAREILDAGDTGDAPSGTAGTAETPETDNSAEDAGAPAEEAGTGRDPAEAAALASRESLLGPVTARLVRSLKRALQDDQNDLLDRLRHAPPGVELDDLIAKDEQEGRYEAAAREGIEAARRAGVSFAEDGEEGDGEPSGASGAGTGAGAGRAGSAAASPVEAELAARHLAEELVGALRLRIAGCLGAAGERDGAADAVGVAYREWKGGRVTEIVGDHATRAFSAGQLAALQAAAAAAGAPQVAWVVDDGGTACPDCDDNALAGPQDAGAAFPTGQRHPPVHPGCRCLLLLVHT